MSIRYDVQISKTAATGEFYSMDSITDYVVTVTKQKVFSQHGDSDADSHLGYFEVGKKLGDEILQHMNSQPGIHVAYRKQRRM